MYLERDTQVGLSLEHLNKTVKTENILDGILPSLSVCHPTVTPVIVTDTFSRHTSRISGR